MNVTTAAKSYDKELNSTEPFIKSMYEDLEKRIEEFEDEIIESNNKVKLSDFISVTVVMGIITIIAFSI
ncbi:hypothetical protein [Kurthia sibirica]|uniref:Uncharacterized protein n=1 Tax=Kurthia sibirica TaxID=202750 RepID=A0A2U3APS2_9BACL|nr:hypothetical protein [Kurthia sibirica]PWI26548.1 hypothetical protein DEX24_01940 [Kurthia sibirica]GEK32797.1 hypothetical protein KSI01_03300 [Kurthia sibirica]